MGFIIIIIVMVLVSIVSRYILGPCMPTIIFHLIPTITIGLSASVLTQHVFSGENGALCIS